MPTPQAPASTSTVAEAARPTVPEFSSGPISAADLEAYRAYKAELTAFEARETSLAERERAFATEASQTAMLIQERHAELEERESKLFEAYTALGAFFGMDSPTVTATEVTAPTVTAAPSTTSPTPSVAASMRSTMGTAEREHSAGERTEEAIETELKAALEAATALFAQCEALENELTRERAKQEREQALAEARTAEAEPLRPAGVMGITVEGEMEPSTPAIARAAEPNPYMLNIQERRLDSGKRVAIYNVIRKDGADDGKPLVRAQVNPNGKLMQSGYACEARSDGSLVIGNKTTDSQIVIGRQAQPDGSKLYMYDTQRYDGPETTARVNGKDGAFVRFKVGEQGAITIIEARGEHLDQLIQFNTKDGMMVLGPDNQLHHMGAPEPEMTPSAALGSDSMALSAEAPAVTPSVASPSTAEPTGPTVTAGAPAASPVTTTPTPTSPTPPTARRPAPSPPAGARPPASRVTSTTPSTPSPSREGFDSEGMRIPTRKPPAPPPSAAAEPPTPEGVYERPWDDPPRSPDSPAATETQPFDPAREKAPPPLPSSPGPISRQESLRSHSDSGVSMGTRSSPSEYKELEEKTEYQEIAGVDLSGHIYANTPAATPPTHPKGPIPQYTAEYGSSPETSNAAYANPRKDDEVYAELGQPPVYGNSERTVSSAEYRDNPTPPEASRSQTVSNSVTPAPSVTSGSPSLERSGSRVTFSGQRDTSTGEAIYDTLRTERRPSAKRQAWEALKGKGKNDARTAEGGEYDEAMYSKQNPYATLIRTGDQPASPKEMMGAYHDQTHRFAKGQPEESPYQEFKGPEDEGYVAEADEKLYEAPKRTDQDRVLAGQKGLNPAPPPRPASAPPQSSSDLSTEEAPALDPNDPRLAKYPNKGTVRVAASRQRASTLIPQFKGLEEQSQALKGAGASSPECAEQERTGNAVSSSSAVDAEHQKKQEEPQRGGK